MELEGPHVPAAGIPAQVTLGRTRFSVDHVQLDAKGQDGLLVRDGFVAVADGSTPLDRSTGGKVADFVQSALAALHRFRNFPAKAQFDRAIRSAGAGFDGMTTPTCGVAAVQVRGADLEAVALADVTVVIKQRGDVYTVLSDSRVAFYDDRSAAGIKAALDAGATFEEARTAIQPLLADQFANHRNKDGGYWVFANDPAAAAQISAIRVPLDSVEAVLIGSDGFFRLCDLFHTAGDPKDLLELARRHGVAALAAEVRRLEQLPGTISDYPRTSVHDDVTAVLLTREQFAGR